MNIHIHVAAKSRPGSRVQYTVPAALSGTSTMAKYEKPSGSGLDRIVRDGGIRSMGIFTHAARNATVAPLPGAAFGAPAISCDRKQRVA